MLLNVNPFHRDNDRFNVSFKALGELIETVGTPHFVPRLTQLLNEVVPLDVAHVERSRVDGSMPTGYRCEWIGSSGIDTESTEISDVMTLYYERFRQRPAVRGAARQDGHDAGGARHRGDPARRIPPAAVRRRAYRARMRSRAARAIRSIRSRWSAAATGRRSRSPR